MKKLIALILALSCIMMLAACNTKTNTDANGDQSAAGDNAVQAPSDATTPGNQGTENVITGETVSAEAPEQDETSGGATKVETKEDSTVSKDTVIKVEINKDGNTEIKTETPPDSVTGDLVISFDELINAGNK